MFVTRLTERRNSVLRYSKGSIIEQTGDYTDDMCPSFSIIIYGQYSFCSINLIDKRK